MSSKLILNKSAKSSEMGIWALLLLLIILLFVQRLIYPSFQEISESKESIEQKTSELKTLKDLIQATQEKEKQSKTLNDPKRKALVQKIKNAFEKNNMSPDVVLSDLVTHLTKPEYAKWAQLEKINTPSEEKKSGYIQMKFDLKLSGSYEGIAQYLSILKELPYLLKLSSLSIKPVKDPNSSRVELLGKGLLFVGEAKNAKTTLNTRSDTAIDILMEDDNLKRTKTPFSMKPRDTEVWSVHELKLTSTISGFGKPTALINNKVFELGDSIADFKLVEIRAKEVVLQKGEVTQVLRINEDQKTNPNDNQSTTNENNNPQEKSKSEVKKEEKAKEEKTEEK